MPEERRVKRITWGQSYGTNVDIRPITDLDVFLINRDDFFDQAF
jgi:hypothetical protein